VVADLADRLLEGVPQEMRPAFEAAAVLRYFNVDAVHALLEGGNAEGVYAELRRWPFIRSRREGLAVHDIMREVINEALRVRTLERFRTLHERAAVYYETLLVFNRFLLDEALSGRELGTPLRPIIAHCLEHGEDGQQMLVALRDWWQTGINDIGTPRPDTISPIPEGIPLLEAERFARNQEPGDGSSQTRVVEQINAVLSSV
jgi:hypothetical protein